MIGWSGEFPTGDVRPLQYFGEELVAYRDDDGALHVLDAHCPHLGAHIGHGGRVRGACAEGPSHAWTGGPDGTNRATPYTARPTAPNPRPPCPVPEQTACVSAWPPLPA